MTRDSICRNDNTKETEIELNTESWTEPGYSDIETGVGFFDHMLGRIYTSRAF